MNLSNISLDRIKGTKPVIISKLNAHNINTIQDLFHLFPKKYEYFEIVDLNNCVGGDNITVEGTIMTPPVSRDLDSKRKMLSFRMLINGKFVDIVVFNRDFMLKQLTKGKFCYITGKYDQEREQITASKVQFPSKSFKRVKPVYGLPDLQDYEVTNVMSNAYVDFFKHIDDELPDSLIDKYKLIGKREMIKIAHFPNSSTEVEEFTKRIKFEELFKFQLKMQYLKLRNTKLSGVSKKIKNDEVAKFISSLPYELTGDQATTIEEIFEDLTQKVKMNRLLQGDVGSGKTIVAAITMFSVITSGYQAALMAPTEILAEQHYRNLVKVFENTNVKIELLTGSIKSAKRKEILSGIKSGKVDIIVGTHSLISEDVVYHNLGYVVTDEQHRFGVAQRKALREKGIDPDVLFMTATPIPRTLAITLFGDMEVSILKEMPKGRIPIKTEFFANADMKDVYQKIQDTVDRKEQVYIVAPLIEESEKLAVMDANTMNLELMRNLSGATRIGVIHGKMEKEERDEVMVKFLNHEIDVLVATTVIEVGVDVKNATLMVILDAHRFGLSQLHQLRGRIGRGELASSCILVNEEITHRIQVMLDNIDGFAISEEDLKLRGPGDFFGSKQSGVPEFSHANIVEDYKVLESSRREANKLVRTKTFYQGDTYKPLRLFLKRSIEQMDI